MNRCPADCGHCEDLAEARADARNEPLSEHEIQDRENAFEKGMGW